MGKHTLGKRASSTATTLRARWLLLAAPFAVACGGEGAAEEAPFAVATTTQSLSATYSVLSNASKQEKLLHIMEEFIPRIEAFWNASTSYYENIEFPGERVPDVTHARALGCIAYVYATLLTAKPTQATFKGLTRAQLKVRIERAIIDGIERHLVSWGGTRAQDWQGAVPATLLGWAAQVTWNDLSPTTRTAVQTMVEYQANQLIPPITPQTWGTENGIPFGDSKAEENAWNSSILALAAAIFDGPNNVTWDHEAKNYAINASARNQDRTPPILNVDGLPLTTWISDRTNLFDDYTLKNAGFFHPTYSQGVFGSLADDAIFYRGVGADVPFAFKHRLKEVWENVMAPLSWDDGDFIMPAGTNWVTHDYQHLPFLAYVATTLQRHDASVLESRAIEMLEERQTQQTGGSLYGHSALGYEVDVVRNAAAAWWIHNLFPASTEPSPTAFDAAFAAWNGVRHFPAHKTVLLRTPTAMVSMLWDDSNSPDANIVPHPTGLVVPSSRDHLDDPVLMQYWPRSAVGNILGTVPYYSCDCPAGGNYFSTAGIIGATRRFSMTAFPDGSTMLLDRGTSSTFVFTFENDPALLVGDRPVYSDGGIGIGTLPGSWANVADRFGLIAKGGTGLLAEEFTDVNSHPAITNPHLRLELTSDNTPRNRGGVVLPLATHDQTSVAAVVTSQPAVSDSDWSALITRALDGTERIAVARWGAPATLSINVTSSRGAPIFAKQPTTSVSGSTGTVSWALPDATGHNIASNGDTAVFYVSSTQPVTVEPLTNAIRITKPGSAVADVTVKNVNAARQVRTNSIRMAAGPQVVVAPFVP